MLAVTQLWANFHVLRNLPLLIGRFSGYFPPQGRHIHVPQNMTGSFCGFTTPSNVIIKNCGVQTY